MSVVKIIDQMAAAGMPPLPAGHPVLDGRIHRFGRKKKAWYALREWTLKNGRQVITGGFGVWQGEDNGAVPVKIDWEGISEEEREKIARQQKDLEAREAERRKKQAVFASNRAKTLWENALEVGQSPYLDRKKVDAEGVRFLPDGTLLVPAWKEGRLAGIQRISPDGEKRFNRGMEKTGACLVLGKIPANPPLILVGEGYATMESIRMATGKEYPAVVAFDCGNLAAVAKRLRAAYPDAWLLFTADDDFALEARFAAFCRDNFGVEPPEIDDTDYALKTADGEPLTITARWNKTGVPCIEADVTHQRRMRRHVFSNAGLTCAFQAAAMVGKASVVCPVFKGRTSGKWTDFNDLHMQEGEMAVTRQIADAVKKALAPDKEAPPVPAAGTAKQGGRGGNKRRERGDFFWDNVNTLLEKFVLIYGTDEVYDSERNLIMKIGAARIAKGTDAVRFWQHNGERREVMPCNVVFDPAEKVNRETHINLFHGWPIKPKKGECRQIISLLEHLCNDDEALVAWILKWIAYPLKHPGAKMRTSILMHGEEGSGKNFFWETIVSGLYGCYACTVGNDEIESQYNEWVSKKLFIVADEVVTRAELRNQKNKLKRLITGDTVQVNPKHLNARVEANRMNIVFLSNESQPLILDRSDRRYAVVWTPDKADKDFYREVADEIRAGGIEAFYHYLLNDVDLTGFDEHTDPPKTKAKAELIELGAPSPERFYSDWEGGILPFPFISCSQQQLYSAFQRWCSLNGERFPPSQVRFARDLLRAGKSSIRKDLVRYDYQSAVKQRIVYLVGSKPDGKTKSQWVEDASNLFEGHLQTYRSGQGSFAGKSE